MVRELKYTNENLKNSQMFGSYEPSQNEKIKTIQKEREISKPKR